MSNVILLIEDESSIADSILYALKTEGMAGVWKTTGQAGLDALHAGSVDAIILDVGLPDCSGFELCKEIRKTTDTPILFLTARGDEIDRVVGFEIGADDYIVKPFSPRELTARIKSILKRSQSKHSSHKASPVPDGFVVDAKACRIRYQDQALDLTRYEYRLLALFLRRPEQVFSRQQLMEHVWEAPEASLDRTVDAHIKTIRAKLREAGLTSDPIQTHRGMGYSFRIVS